MNWLRIVLKKNPKVVLKNNWFLIVIKYKIMTINNIINKSKMKKMTSFMTTMMTICLKDFNVHTKEINNNMKKMIKIKLQ